MSALLTSANPRRIKATHRRRRKVASGRFVQRYYDAEIGRFISPDPVGPEEDFVNHFNRYNYAQNNPVRYTDPDGTYAVYFENTRTLVIPVHFTGEMATKNNISTIVGMANSVRGYGIDRVVIAPQSSPGSGVNVLNLSSGPDYNIGTPTGEGVVNSSIGHINTDNADWMGAALHDIPHFAGFPDGYETIPKSPNYGKPIGDYTKNDLMATRGSGTNITANDYHGMLNGNATKTGDSGGGPSTRRPSFEEKFGRNVTGSHIRVKDE